MDKTKVVHCKKEQYDIYIGRPSIYGNPWGIVKGKADFIVGNREVAVDNFEKWLTGDNFQNILQERRTSIILSLHTLQGKTLGCWCSPKKCHGDILAKFADITKEILNEGNYCS